MRHCLSQTACRNGFRRTRHHFRSGHDCLQRHRRLVPAVRGCATSRAGFPSARSKRCSGRARPAHNPHNGRTQFHDQHARACLQHVAACLRCDRLPCPLRLIRLRANGASPRLFPASSTVEMLQHAPPPSTSVALASLGLSSRLLSRHCRTAKALTPSLENLIASLGAPKAVVGVAIAMLVLMPESLAALRSARANQLQTSLNLALGSALASIGLTIPAVAVVSIMLGQQFDLGLHAKEIVLLALTLLVCVITLGTGRTTVSGRRASSDLCSISVPDRGAIMSALGH